MQIVSVGTIGAGEAIPILVTFFALFFWHIIIEAKLIWWGIEHDDSFKIDWMAKGWHTLMYIIKNPFKKDKRFASLVLQGRISLLLLIAMMILCFALSGSFS